MKNFLFLLATLMAILSMAVQCKSSTHTTNNPPSNTIVAEPTITSLEYQYKGMRGDIRIQCTLNRLDDGNYLASYTEYEEKKEVNCGEDVAKQIYAFLKEGNFMKYRDYYDPGPNVHDGNTWRITVKFDNGKSKTSGGRISKPKDFSAVNNTLDYLKKICE